MSATEEVVPPPAPHSDGNINPRLIEREMKESYLTYALSVLGLPAILLF